MPAPGTFLTARLTPALARTATVVPRRSLVNGRIYLVQDDLVEPVKVRTLFEIDRQLPSFGLPDQRWVVLEEALQDGTYVVVSGNQSPPAGARVRPVVAAAREAPLKAARATDPDADEDEQEAAP